MGLTGTSAVFTTGNYYEQKNRVEKEIGRPITNAEFEESYLVKASSNGGLSDTGTSVFDPVLCEIDYLWFTAAGDEILDPFAGGSVRGVVASLLGRRYTGIELRREQVEENVAQGLSLCREQPTWICADSAAMDDVLPSGYMCDHVFTCPPYGDLEIYSDDPRDISNMAHDDFDAKYGEILGKACGRLRDDRFATVVVGNYRDSKGRLRDLSGLTVSIMERAGLRYYNDMILVTTAGSLPIRVGKQFRASRKVGRNHQYVLNFVKGDPKKATVRLGDVSIPDISVEQWD